MIYVYRCRGCGCEIERSESMRQPHEMRGFCPYCGERDNFKRVLFPTGPPAIVYKGNPRGFAGKQEAQRKRYREAMDIASRTYTREPKRKISEDDNFWQKSAEEFDSYRPPLFSGAEAVSSGDGG